MTNRDLAEYITELMMENDKYQAKQIIRLATQRLENDAMFLRE